MRFSKPPWLVGPRYRDQWSAADVDRLDTQDEREGGRMPQPSHLTNLVGRYHPDPEINAEVAEDVLRGEEYDLSVGARPSRWECECGAQHARGHFQVIGVHRCLGCGYVGTGGRMFHEEDERDAA